MTAYEMVDGKYYVQHSDEYFSALERQSFERTGSIHPQMDLGTFLGRFFKRNGVKPQDATRILIQSLSLESYDSHCGDRQEE